MIDSADLTAGHYEHYFCSVVTGESGLENMKKPTHFHERVFL